MSQAALACKAGENPPSVIDRRQHVKTLNPTVWRERPIAAVNHSVDENPG